MPVYVAPFVFVLGIAVLVYGLKRPGTEFADDRRRGFSDPGWPTVNLIGRLPVPLARAVWMLLGLMIIAGAVLSVV